MVNNSLRTSGWDNLQHNKIIMKKIITLNLLAGWLATTAAFGQGYFMFTTGKSQIYDGFTTPGVSTLAATVNTSFLWGPANTTPAVDSLVTSTPANGINTLNYGYSTAQAWNYILNGQFNVATNSATGNLVVQLCGANGSIIYNGATAFSVAGTVPNTIYTLYEISWDAHFATPALAAAAGAALGWSSPFQYTSGNVASPVAPMPTTGFSAGGTLASFGTIASVPEPTTLALAVLGGLSLLACRRK